MMKGVLSRMSKTIVAIAARADFGDNRRCGSVISYSREVNHGTRIEFDEDCGASFARGD